MIPWSSVAKDNKALILIGAAAAAVLLLRKSSGGSDVTIHDRTPFGDPNSTFGSMTPSGVTLHQMGFSRGDDLDAYDKVHAHFIITHPSGNIVQLHPLDVRAKNAFDFPDSIQIEFAGNFPSTAGRWWSGDTHGEDEVTLAQVESGRALLEHLQESVIEGHPIISGHRMSNPERGNDPGPGIWAGVARYAVESLGWGLAPAEEGGSSIPTSWWESQYIPNS